MITERWGGGKSVFNTPDLHQNERAMGGREGVVKPAATYPLEGGGEPSHSRLALPRVLAE